MEEYKTQYVDKNEKKPVKGITKTDLREFEKKNPIRNINIITFRVLNFSLYSYLLGSYILGNLTKEQIKPFLVEGIFPQSLFGVIKKNWELLESSLNEIGIESVQVFFNMILEGLISLFSELKDVDTDEKLYTFEKKVDEYIMGKILPKNNAEKLNKDYQDINNKLLNFDPFSMKEIILGNYDPSIYSQEIYPDIQYYTVSKIQNYENFVNKFNSSKENQNKYFLINTLIKKDEDLTQNIIAMKNLEAINQISNLLLLIYSYKIGRDEAKKKIMKDEIPHIIKIYNEINSVEIKDEKQFIEKYFEPFLKGWKKIKSKAFQYQCRLLRNFEKGEKP